MRAAMHLPIYAIYASIEIALRGFLMTNMRSLNDLPNSAAKPLPSDSINPAQPFDQNSISDAERGLFAVESSFSLLSGKTGQCLDLFRAQPDGHRPKVLVEMG